MHFADLLSKQSKTIVFFEALLIVGAIGFVDSIGGWDVSLFLFYALPILMVVWFGDRRLAIVCAMACGVAWFAAKLPTHPYGTSIAYAWATFNRLAYFLFVAIGGAAMKEQREALRARVEAMTRARELEQEIVRVSEHEQIRIGQELHDGLCQNLAAIDCAAACLKADLEARGLPESEIAGAIQEMLKDAVLEARSLARGIFPVQMDSQGLPAALEELVAATNRLRQVATTLEVVGDVQIQEPETAMHLYRIAQQALNNALQHAKPSHVVICLRREGDLLHLLVSDDGCGFDWQRTPSHGMGLRTMQYRARLLGGDFKIESALGRGATVHCTLPFSYGYNR